MNPLSRRQFLAAGVGGGAGLAIENQVRRLRAVEKPWNASTGRALRKFRDPIPTACPGCGASCALVAFRDGSRVVQVGPNPSAVPAGALCPRAYESLEALYDPERVLVPLRREGPRGAGRWREIGWDEALDLVAPVLGAAPASAYVEVGRPDPLAGVLLQRLGVERRIEHGASMAWSAREAQRAVYGLPLGRPRLDGAAMVLLAGARPLDGGPGFSAWARDLMHARAGGTQVVALSSYEGPTGSLADEWIPVRPGTAALVLLGIARILLSERWYDPEDLTGATGATAEQLLQTLFPYTADLVEASAGVPAIRLVQLARRIAEQRPSLCVADGAGTTQALTLEAAAALLNSLEGSPESVGVRLAHAPSWIPSFEPTLPRTRAVKDILAGNERASLYLAYRANPLYWSPRSDTVRRAFADESRVGLLVAMDTHLTETAELADLVLPASTDLEMWNLLGGYTPEGRPYAVLQQPATRASSEPAFLASPDTEPGRLFDAPPPAPLGEARQLGDLLLGVLDRLGHPLREDFPHPDCGSYVRELGDTVPPLAADGGFERLGREGSWLGRTVSYPWAADRGFPTQSGLVEVRARLVHRVPREFKRLEGDAFALVVLEYPELDPGYANSRWGREIRFENPLLMNAEAARRLGLEAGDRVVIHTEVGQAVAPVMPIQGIHPQAVAVGADFGHWAGGVAATARGAPSGASSRPLLVERRDFLSNPLGIAAPGTEGGEAPWWHTHGAGFSVAAMSPFTSDEHGAQAWREVRVTVHKV